MDWKQRRIAHKCSIKNPKHYFGMALRKHGWDNFEQTCLIDDVPEIDLDDLEREYIAVYKSNNKEFGYNLTEGGEGSSGRIPTAETRQKISKGHTKNHTVEGGGSITFNKREKKWQVQASGGSRKLIGFYFTKEKAVEALRLYNTTGKRLESDKIEPTGSISKKGEKYRIQYKGYHGGTYETVELAEEALKGFKKQIDAGIFPEKRRRGCIFKQKRDKNFQK